MRYSLILLFCLVSLVIVSQNNKAIETILSKENLDNSTIGISIKSTDGKDIVSYNKKQSLSPASTLKLLTTATALELLGDTYKYQTLLMFNKQDPHQLVIKGFGDPTLGSEFINQSQGSFIDIWLPQIVKNIANDKPISILIDDSYFGYQGISDKWLYEDLGNYYAAGAYGISIYDNMYKLTLNSLNVNACPRIIKTFPQLDINFDNQLLTNNTGRDKSSIRGLPFSNDRKLVGSIPANRSSYVIKGDIPDPGFVLGKVLAEALKNSGYTIKDATTVRNAYQSIFCTQQEQALIPTSTIFYQNWSPTLADIVKVINVDSNNHYTEHLIRSLGKTKNQSMFSNSLQDGIQVINDYWAQNGVNTESLYMYDGCGLAPSDKISTDMLTNVLLYMYNKSKYTDSFINSLPKAGQNGTVRNFLKGTRLEGKVFVKSGSINNVQAFAGYYISGDKIYVFSVIVNNFNSPRKQVVRAIENILLSYLVD